MADKQISIGIQTTADISAIQKTEQQLTALNQTGSQAAVPDKAATETKQNLETITTEAKKTEKALDGVAKQSTKTGNSSTQAATKTANFGYAMMNVAQFADDAQYGLKGVVNNIAPMAMSFGLGAAASGGLTIALVAANQALNYFTEEQTKAEAAAKSFGENAKTSYETPKPALKAIQKEIEYENQLKEVGLNYILNETKALEAQLKTRASLRGIATENAKLEAELQIQKIEASDAPESEKKSKIGRIKASMAKLEGKNEEESLKDQLELNAQKQRELDAKYQFTDERYQKAVKETGGKTPVETEELEKKRKIANETKNDTGKEFAAGLTDALGFFSKDFLKNVFSNDLTAFKSWFKDIQDLLTSAKNEKDPEKAQKKYDQYVTMATEKLAEVEKFAQLNPDSNQDAYFRDQIGTLISRGKEYQGYATIEKGFEKKIDENEKLKLKKKQEEELKAEREKAAAEANAGKPRLIEEERVIKAKLQALPKQQQLKTEIAEVKTQSDVKKARQDEEEKAKREQEKKQREQEQKEREKLTNQQRTITSSNDLLSTSDKAEDIAKKYGADPRWVAALDKAGNVAAQDPNAANINQMAAMLTSLADSILKRPDAEPVDKIMIQNLARKVQLVEQNVGNMIRRQRNNPNLR